MFHLEDVVIMIGLKLKLRQFILMHKCHSVTPNYQVWYAVFMFSYVDYLRKSTYLKEIVITSCEKCAYNSALNQR